MKNRKSIIHDGEIYYPTGAAPYIWREKYVDYILENGLKKSEVKISIGVEPNGTPHFGTLTAISVAFSLAEKIKEAGKKVTVVIDLIDTGEGFSIEIEGAKYQKSLAYTGVINNHIHEFREILENYSFYSEVDFEIKTQKDFNLHPEIPKVIKKIVSEREKIEPLLSPNLKSTSLRLRVPCPKCGLTDIFGAKNVYKNDMIYFFCPVHGEHSVDINKDPYNLEYNVSLRYLVRCLIRQEDNKNTAVPYDWVMIDGSDYAGFYQEQIWYRIPLMLGAEIKYLPFVVYSPLITDWSGAKLSKSLHIKSNSYNYLVDQGLDYVINYGKFKEKFGTNGLRFIYKETNLWLNEPYRLFRNYSIYYFDHLFKELENKKNSWVRKLNELRLEATFALEVLEEMREWEKEINNKWSLKEMEEYGQDMIKKAHQLTGKEKTADLQQKEVNVDNEYLIVHRDLRD